MNLKDFQNLLNDQDKLNRNLNLQLEYFYEMKIIFHTKHHLVVQK